MIIIIDSNILITDPSILTQKKDNLTLVVPAGVRDELITISGRKNEVKSIISLINSGVANGTIQIDEAGIPTNLPQSRLSFTDLQVISLALKYKEQNIDVVIATLDRDVQVMGQFMGIQYFDLAQLKQKLTGSHIENRNDFKKAQKYKKRQWTFLFINFAVGVTASILANLVWQYFDLTLDTIRVWGTILLIFISSLFLYWFRGRHRLMYGVTEFAFGFIMASKVFFPDFDYEKLKIISFLQVVAGIYVMVRGMDNFGKGIKDTGIEYYWNKFANESRTSKSEQV